MIAANLDIRLGREVEVTPVGLGLTRKCVLKVLFSLAAFQ